MEIFGQEIELKQEYCSIDLKKPEKVSKPYVNLYVRLNNTCNAHCPFCIFKGSHVDFDFHKFYYVLHELKKNLSIVKVSFTGGEPTLSSELLMNCARIVKELDSEIFTVVNTNGYNLNESLFENINSVSLSRHAASDKINSKLFKLNINDNSLGSLSDSLKKKIHISCNLISGIVDSGERVLEFIDRYSSLGFHDFGFVSLMKVNDYCEKFFIDFNKINLEKNSEVIKTRTQNQGESCKCANYLVTGAEGSFNKVYARHYCDVKKNESTLVYDLNVLKNGFTGPTIY